MGGHRDTTEKLFLTLTMAIAYLHHDTVQSLTWEMALHCDLAIKPGHSKSRRIVLHINEQQAGRKAEIRKREMRLRCGLKGDQQSLHLTEAEDREVGKGFMKKPVGEWVRGSKILTVTHVGEHSLVCCLTHDCTSA